MKKAVISIVGKQHVVTEGDEIVVDRVGEDKDKSISLTPLLVIDGDKTQVGTPEVAGAKVTLKVVDHVRGDKVTAIRYKPKKRVRKVRGHRQEQTRLSVEKIS